MKAEINRELELVEILLYLSDRQERTAQELKNSYYISKIQLYFGNFTNHEAVILTRQLIDKQNFIHIKPIRAIFSLDTIFGDETNSLYRWAAAVQHFITDTKFDEFFNDNRAYYDMILCKIKPFNIKNALILHCHISKVTRRI